MCGDHVYACIMCLCICTVCCLHSKLYSHDINIVCLSAVAVCYRDFGYVARNPDTQQHQCHVFRCDIAAKGVARALLDSHKENKTKGVGGGGGSGGGGGGGGGGGDKPAGATHSTLSPQTSRGER